MNIVDYHIFINLLPKNIKKSFAECRQIVFFFALVRTAILFHFFSPLQKYAKFSCSAAHGGILFSLKKKKKLEEKIINKAIKKNCKKDRASTIKIFLKITKIKQEIMLTLKIKVFPAQTEE